MASMIHAFLAPLLLSVLVAIAVATSKSWQHEPVCLPDKGWPSLRGVARNTLVLVVIQVALGAAFRYDVIGVMTHIIGALVVALEAWRCVRSGLDLVVADQASERNNP